MAVGVSAITYYTQDAAETLNEELLSVMSESAMMNSLIRLELKTTLRNFAAAIKLISFKLDTECL